MAAMFSKDEIFQLTPSRRATEQLLAENEQLIISTHALTEGDPLYQDSDENYQAFQLTPSRRATGGLFGQMRRICYFNSRPHGGRRSRNGMKNGGKSFQLTPSRRATLGEITEKADSTFQLTPSRRATEWTGTKCEQCDHFNSRPHGGRLQI